MQNSGVGLILHISCGTLAILIVFCGSSVII